MNDAEWKQLIDEIEFGGALRQMALGLELLNKIHNNWFFEAAPDNKILIHDTVRIFRFINKLDSHFRYWQILHIFLKDDQYSGLYNHTIYQNSIVRNRIKRIKKPFIFSELELTTLSLN